MAKIADMQIEAKRRRPFRCRVQERRRVRRIERARAKLLAGPDAGGRYQVRKNAGRDDGPANVRNAMPREASQPGFHGVYRSEEHTSELQSLRHLVCRLL